MERINELTRDCLNALIQIRNLDDGPQPSAALLHQRMRGFIDELIERAPKAGLSERDTQDIVYAIVALADEIAVAKPDPLRSYWLSNLLQLQYFNENVAGEGFFRRLDAVRGDERRNEVLQVYYQCLLLGFQGRYAVRGGEVELMALIDRVGQELTRDMDIPEELSPQADRPDEGVARGGGWMPWLIVSGVAIVLSVVVFFGLRSSIGGTGDDAVDRIAESAR